MKRSVKIISIVCLIAMLIGIVPAFSVSAANEPTLKITPSATSVNVGDTFTLTVSLENNPGLWSLLVKVSVDTTAFDFVEAEFDDTIFDQGGICDFKVEEGIYEMNRNYSDSFANVTEDGVVGAWNSRETNFAPTIGSIAIAISEDLINVRKFTINDETNTHVMEFTVPKANAGEVFGMNGALPNVDSASDVNVVLTSNGATIISVVIRYSVAVSKDVPEQQTVVIEANYGYSIQNITIE